LLEQDEELRQKREKQNQRKKELEQQLTSAQSKIKDINDKLRDSKNAKVLQQQRDRLEKDLKQRRQELTKVVEEIRNGATISYTVVAQPAIQKALQFLNEKREKGEIPSNIREQFIQDLLEQMICICGRPLSQNIAQNIKRLLSLMDKAVPSPFRR
jgi:DNA sulfur modification protein DndD